MIKYQNMREKSKQAKSLKDQAFQKINGKQFISQEDERIRSQKETSQDFLLKKGILMEVN